MSSLPLLNSVYEVASASPQPHSQPSFLVTFSSSHTGLSILHSQQQLCLVWNVLLQSFSSFKTHHKCHFVMNSELLNLNLPPSHFLLHHPVLQFIAFWNICNSLVYLFIDDYTEWTFYLSYSSYILNTLNSDRNRGDHIYKFKYV